MEKFKKVIVALVATAFIAMSAFVFVGCGENEGDGSENAVKWSGEAGTVPTAVEQVIEIENGEQLAALALKVSNDYVTYEGYTVKLMADINLDNKAWTPIGNTIAYGSSGFWGVFDGNGHTIYNLNVSAAAAGSESAGLFGAIAGTVKNLTLKNVTVTGTRWAGAIVGYAHENGTSVIENCKVIGGTVTVATELVDSEYDNGDKAGGIIGYMVNTTVKNCEVKNVTINGYRDLGGVVGYANTGTTVTGNTIENVTIKVNKEHNYKNYTELAEHDANSIIGETVSGAVVSGNSGNASIAFA